MVEVKTDDGCFIYALPRNRKHRGANYNPYDLQVVSPNEARSNRVYWTATASNVTMVRVGYRLIERFGSRYIRKWCSKGSTERKECRETFHKDVLGHFSVRGINPNLETLKLFVLDMITVILKQKTIF